MSNKQSLVEQFLQSGAMAYPCGERTKARLLLKENPLFKDIPVATRVKSVLARGAVATTERSQQTIR